MFNDKYMYKLVVSKLVQEIMFFQINALKIFNAINAVAGLGLATPLKPSASVSFLLKSIAFI